jgi:hypothetical protein
MLDRVASTDLLQNEIATHFNPYVAKHDLNQDDLILEYCMEIMDGSGKDQMQHKYQLVIDSLIRKGIC